MNVRHFTTWLWGLALLMLVGCDNKKQQPETADESQMPVFEFSSSDSLIISQLADEYLAAFSVGDFNSASNMLYTVRGDSVFPLTDEERASYIDAMSHLPQHGCQKKEVILNTDRDNRVRIALLMNPEGSLEEEIGTINYYLNPIKVEGQWYLTAFDPYAEGVGIY